MYKGKNFETAVKGFHSKYPEEWTKWRRVIKIVEDTLKTFRFKEISTPSIEKKRLYKVKPPWSEGLINQTYSFFDKNKDELILIPEQTPTRARMVQEMRKIKLPIRWFNTSKRWRQEKLVEKVRDKEFWQTDADVIGSSSVESDAEILACVANIYRNLKLGDKVEILISDRKLLENILSYVGINDYYNAVKIIDDKEKISNKEFFRRFEDLGLNKNQVIFLDNLTSIKDSDDEGIEKVKKVNKQITKKSKDILKRLTQISKLLKWYDIYDMCRLDLSVARGSFYTGIIFEVFDKNKELGALSGGGRYDWLISKYGKRNLPAIGFGLGYSGTVKKLKNSGLFYSSKKKEAIFVSCESPQKNYEMAIKLVAILRTYGYTTEIDIGKGCSNLDDLKCFIILKADFCKNHRAEINIKGKRKIVKIDDFYSFSKNLKISQYL